MSNFFETIKGDLKDLENDVLGPDYPYHKMIKSPEEIGMSDEGSLSTIANNVTGLISYIDLLAVGGGKASSVDGPLGSRFFLKTGAKCKDTATGNQVQRSIYFDFIPDGSLPFISSTTGLKFSTFEGLVPGVMTNLAHVHPTQMFQAFMTGGNPDCSAVTLSVRDETNQSGQTETAYLTLDDQKTLQEDFTTLSDMQDLITQGTGLQGTGLQGTRLQGTGTQKSKTIKMPNDPLLKIYYSALALLGLYIFMRLLKKKSI